MQGIFLPFVKPNTCVYLKRCCEAPVVSGIAGSGMCGVEALCEEIRLTCSLAVINVELLFFLGIKRFERPLLRIMWKEASNDEGWTALS